VDSHGEGKYVWSIFNEGRLVFGEKFSEGLIAYRLSLHNYPLRLLVPTDTEDSYPKIFGDREIQCAILSCRRNSELIEAR